MHARIATSLLSIIATLSIVGGATYAYFSDQGQSLGNTIQTGTLHLRLSDNDETENSSVTASFGGNLAPGECSSESTLTLKNTGTITADHVRITVANTVTDVGNDSSIDMPNFLRIQTLTYDGADSTGSLADSNGNGFQDLADWASATEGLGRLPLHDLNSDHTLTLQICLDESATNDLQGDSVSTVITSLLNQDASQ